MDNLKKITAFETSANKIFKNATEASFYQDALSYKKGIEKILSKYNTASEYNALIMDILIKHREDFTDLITTLEPKVFMDTSSLSEM